MLRSQLLETLTTYILAKEVDHPLRVAIDGIDNAGKSKLAKELTFPLRKSRRQVISVSIDGFHYPKKFRYRRGEYSPEGYYYDSFNHEAVISDVLQPLSPQGKRQFRRQIFDYTVDKVVDSPWEKAEDDAILLFDGVFLQRQEFYPFWDIIIFVDIDEEVSLDRAIKRDLHYYHSIETIERKYHQRYFPAHKIYFDRCHPIQRADIIIDNDDWQNPNITFQRAVAG